jgi:hypothetical protein
MYRLDRPTRQWLWVHFLVNTPTMVWGTLFRLQLHTLRPLRHETPRFPTPPDRP